MGVLNVTPDSFSGDGLLAGGDPVAAAVARRGGWSRTARTSSTSVARRAGPGHVAVAPDEEAARVVPVIRARGAPPSRHRRSPIDTTSVEVAAAALDDGAHLLNDVWGVADDPAMARPRGGAWRAAGRDAQPRRAALRRRRRRGRSTTSRGALDRARGRRRRAGPT